MVPRDQGQIQSWQLNLVIRKCLPHITDYEGMKGKSSLKRSREVTGKGAASAVVGIPTYWRFQAHGGDHPGQQWSRVESISSVLWTVGPEKWNVVHSVGTQRLVNESQMPDTELQDLELPCWTSVLFGCDHFYTPVFPF